MKTKEINVQAIIFFVISILFFICITAFDPFISIYASELGFKSSTIGTIVGAAGIASMLFRFPIGILSDFIHNRRLVIQIGLIITIVAWGIAFLNPSPTTLYIGKIADGITGATWVIYNIMFISYFKENEAAKAVGLLAVVSPIGSLIGSFIGGFIANTYGYKYSFVVAIVSAMLAFLLTFLLKPQKRTDNNINKEKYSLNIVKEQLSDKYIWGLGIIAIVSMMVPYSTRDTFTPIIASELGGGAIAITILSNIHMITNGIGASLSGTFFYKRFGLVKTAMIGAIGQGIVCMLIPFATNIGLLMVLQCLAGFTFGLNFTVLTSMSVDGIDSEKQSTRMGLFQSLYSIGMFFGPVMMGNLVENTSMLTGFMFIGILSIISGVFMFRIKDKRYKKLEVNQ